jgi:hypothetical protein
MSKFFIFSDQLNNFCKLASLIKPMEVSVKQKDKVCKLIAFYYNVRVILNIPRDIVEDLDYSFQSENLKHLSNFKNFTIEVEKKENEETGNFLIFNDDSKTVGVDLNSKSILPGNYECEKNLIFFNFLEKELFSRILNACINVNKNLTTNASKLDKVKIYWDEKVLFFVVYNTYEQLKIKVPINENLNEVFSSLGLNYFFIPGQSLKVLKKISSFYSKKEIVNLAVTEKIFSMKFCNLFYECPVDDDFISKEFEFKFTDKFHVRWSNLKELKSIKENSIWEMRKNNLSIKIKNSNYNFYIDNPTEFEYKRFILNSTFLSYIFDNFSSKNKNEDWITFNVNLNLENSPIKIEYLDKKNECYYERIIMPMQER